MLLDRFSRIACVCMALLGCSYCVSAVEVETDDSIALTSRQLENITVSAVHSPSKVSSTGLVQTITGDELKSMGAQSVSDAVKRFAGTNVRDYGGIGGLKTVSVRNLGAAHTAVSYDGVVVSNCQAGQVDVGRFSLDNVSSLSLAVGHDDDMLQPAKLYASAGVLKIDTEQPRFDGKNHYSELRLAGGDYGYITPSFRHWQKLGEQTGLTVGGNYMRADGCYPFKLVNGTVTTDEKRNNSDIESYHAEANLFHSLSSDDRLSVKAYYFNSERGLPGAVVLYNNHSDERLWDRNFFVQAKYRRPLSQKFALQVQGKYNYSWNKYVDEGVEYENGIQTDINRQNEYYMSAVLQYSPVSSIDVSLAQDGAVNKLHTNGVSSPEPMRYTSLTAFNVRYRNGHVKVLGNLVATYMSDEVKTGTKPNDRKRLSPSLSVSYRPFMSQQLYLRAMYKNTFRVPTFTDLYYLRIGNTGLKSEKATEYSAGVTWSGCPLDFMKFLSVTADGYINRVTDKIIAFPSTYVWKMQNYGKVNIAGVDLTATTAVNVTRNIGLTVSANYSWQQALDVTDKTAKNYKDQLPYTPEHSGNISATVETPWVNLGYHVSMVGKRYFMAQNIKANEIDGYSEHTATVWREFKIGNTSLRAQGELINLTNAQYDVIKYYPMPGRTWRLSGILKF